MAIKHTNLTENIQSLFPLRNGNAKGGFTNLNAQQIFMWFQFVRLKLTVQLSLKLFDTIIVITHDDNAININHQINAWAKWRVKGKNKVISLKGELNQPNQVSYHKKMKLLNEKTHHLVKTTRTLLLHYNVPLYFQCDALLTVCYLINHMLSSVLNNQILYSILYPHQDLYHIPLSVFGSTILSMIILQVKISFNTIQDYWNCVLIHTQTDLFIIKS